MIGLAQGVKVFICTTLVDVRRGFDGLSGMLRQIAILAIVSTVCGCQAIPHQADPAWLTDFAKTDTIELHTQNDSRKTSDPATIERIQRIYSVAEWNAYRVTLPASIMNRVIYLYDDDVKLRRLCYSQSGTLWEFDASDDVRTATVSGDDRVWLDKLFDPSVEPNGG